MNLKPLFRSRPMWKLAALGVFMLAALIAARELPLLEWIERFRLWAAQFGVAGIFIYGAMFGVVTILMLPCLPLTILAGFTFGMVGGLVAVFFGIAISAAFGFLFARYVARGAVVQQIEGHPRFQTIDSAIAKEGWKIVGLLRMCPVPLGVTNYLYGLTGIPFWRYMAATMVGLTPPNVLFVYLGAFGKRTIEGPRDPLEYALGGLTLVALIGVVVVLRRIALRATATEPRPNV
ncbi:MAG: TVP38/TMEM64 family protein [Chthoniobacterales bacterium]